MPTTALDSLTHHHTGASSHQGAQTDPHASYGNYIAAAADLFHSLGYGIEQGRTIPNVQPIWISGVNPLGVSVITAPETGKLAFRAPDSSTRGAKVAIADTETKTLQDGSNTSHYIRAKRTSATNLKGNFNLNIQDIYNGLIQNWTNAERATGHTVHRAVGFLVNATDKIGRMRAKLQLLGAAATLDTGYAASGAVTVDASDASDWPERAFAVKNLDTGEVMYCSTRSGNICTIPAAGRDLWGDGASLGTIGDDLVPIPLCRVGWEAPSSQPSGNFTLLADEEDSTAQLSVTWNHGTTWAASAEHVPVLDNDEIAALWIQFKIPAGAVANHADLSAIDIGFFDVDGWGSQKWGGSGWGSGVDDGTPDHLHALRGRHRTRDSTLDPYNLFLNDGSAPDPDTDTADETFSSLPHTTTATIPEGGLPGAGLTTTVHALVTAVNQFALESKNRSTNTFEIDENGDLVATPPSAPHILKIEAAAAGAGTVWADYRKDQDQEANQADTWVIWKTNGSDPDPEVDTPLATETMSFRDGVARLRYTVAAEADGTDVRIIVRARRAGTPNSDSENTTVSSYEAETSGPAVPAAHSAHLGHLAEDDLN